MEPSSATPTTDPILRELTLIRQAFTSALELLQGQKRSLDDLRAKVGAMTETVDGFTSGGTSFLAHQVDPMIVVYAALLGPILGDRLDAVATKGAPYEDEMIRGAVPLALRLLRELDAYRSQAGGRSYLEHVAGDIQDPGQHPPEPPTIAPH